MNVKSISLKSKILNDEHLKKFYQSEKKFIAWIDEAKKDDKIKSHQSSELIANQFHSIIKGQIFYPVLFGVIELSKHNIEESKITSKNFFLNSFC